MFGERQWWGGCQPTPTDAPPCTPYLGAHVSCVTSAQVASPHRPSIIHAMLHSAKKYFLNQALHRTAHCAQCQIAASSREGFHDQLRPGPAGAAAAAPLALATPTSVASPATPVGQPDPATPQCPATPAPAPLQPAPPSEPEVAVTVSAREVMEGKKDGLQQQNDSHIEMSLAFSVIDLRSDDGRYGR